MAATPIASVQGLRMSYGAGSEQRIVLDGVDLTVEPKDTIGLVGPSGSGKTTLLHALGGLIAPSSGSILWKGEPLGRIEARARRAAPAAGIAYVFQGSNLLPTFTALDDIRLAQRAARRAGRSTRQGASELLASVGLADHGERLPSELSGGEAQRVAIARAIAQEPELLLCDEPTGHLDSDTSRRVIDLLLALQQQREFALVVATHDVGIAGRMDRTVHIADGRISAGAESG